MNIRHSLLVVPFLLLTCFANAQATETINLVTYYPVPFGAYDQVRLVPRSAAPTCSASTIGAMYIDSDDDKLYVCKVGNTWTTLLSNPDVWTQSGNNVYPSATGSNPNLLVGIRTITPANPLTVSGSASIGAGYAATAAPANGLLVQGNMGIGTTAVVNQLDVEGKAVIGATYSGTSAAPANGLLVEGNVGLGTTAVVNKLDVEGAAAIGATYSGTTAAPSNGLIVEGNTGIGTNAPARLLHVAGAMRLSTVAAPGTPAAGDIYSSGTGLFYYNGTTWVNMTLSGGYWTASGTNIFNNNAGLVGIGTSDFVTYTHKLNVVSTTDFKAAIYATNNTNDGFGLWANVPNNTAVRANGEYGVWAVGTSNTAVLAQNWNGWGDGVQADIGAGGGDAIEGNSSGGGNAGRFNGNVYISGNLSKGSGSFVQPHPTDPTKEMNYAFFEGRDNNIFFNGTAKLSQGVATIKIPEDFQIVSSDQTPVNVILTPFGKASLYVKERGRKEFVVATIDEGREDIEFGYLVIAIRGGYEESQPIQENQHFHPEEDKTAREFEYRFVLKDSDAYYSRLGKALNRKLLIQNGTLNPDGTLNKKLAERLGWKYQEFENTLGGSNE